MASHDNQQRGRPSMTRAVSYTFESDKDLEYVTDDLLERELRREGTPVTQYGTDGLFLWLNGAPGGGLRQIVSELEALGWRRAPVQP